MKLINIEDGKLILARQILYLIRALPAFEQIAEFRDLQEYCIFTITPPVSHLITWKNHLYQLPSDWPSTTLPQSIGISPACCTSSSYIPLLLFATLLQ